MNFNRPNGNQPDDLFNNRGDLNPDLEKRGSAPYSSQENQFDEQQFQQNMQNNFAPPADRSGEFNEDQFRQNLQTPPPYQNGGYGQPPQQKSILAIVSLVLGAASLITFCCCGVISILLGIGAVVCGLISINSGEPDRDLAIVGIAIGGIAIVLKLLFVGIGLLFRFGGIFSLLRK